MYLSKSSGEPDSLDLVQLLRTLGRRRFIIASVAILCTVLMLIYVTAAKPRYRSDIEIVVEGKSGPFVVLDQQGPAQIEKDTSIEDAVEILKSRKLARRVVEQLGLMSDPEFHPQQNFVQRWLSEVRSAVFPPPPATPIDAELQKQIDLDRITQVFLDRLTVERVDRSSVLAVSFTSEVPETAWKVVNAVGEIYLAWRTEQKFETARKANAWLDDRTRDLAQRVQRADKAAEEYRGTHGLLEGERVALISEQISRLNTNLIDASSERKKAEADLSQVKRLIATAGDVTGAQQILDSQLYVRLREQQLEIERDYAERSRELGPQHPLILQLQAKLDRAQQDIKSEVGKVVLSLENKAAAAKQREGLLTDDLNKLKQDLAQANVRSVELRALEQEAEANREMLHKIVSGAMEKQAEQAPGAQSPQASVISAAIFPDTPVAPKKALLLILAAGAEHCSAFCSRSSPNCWIRPIGRAPRSRGICRYPSCPMCRSFAAATAAKACRSALRRHRSLPPPRRSGRSAPASPPRNPP